MAHVSHIFLLVFLGAVGQSVLEFGSPCFGLGVVWVWSFLFPWLIEIRILSFLAHVCAMAGCRLTLWGIFEPVKFVEVW